MNVSNLSSRIASLGETMRVLKPVQTTTDSFGGEETAYEFSHTVQASRTYPNRNTEVEKRYGERYRDNPMFVVPTAPRLPEPPAEGDRIEFANEQYEVLAHTNYGSHVEFMAENVYDG